MNDVERIYDLITKVNDYTIELEKETEELKKQVAELENASKPKRKFRAMTVKEHCIKVKNCKKCSYYCDLVICDYTEFNGVVNKSIAPYKTKNGKYILIEVKG